MSARLKARIEDARGVASYLGQRGDAFRAEQILALCRSAACSMRVNALLHKDNMELRGTGVAPEPTATAEPLAAPTPPSTKPIWCSQCDTRVSASEAARCGSPWCKARRAA